MDEVHFQQHGSRCRMWVAPEVKDPVLLHHPTRKSVGYFGAVRLRDGKFVFAREQNCFDAATTWAFLRLLHQRSRQRQRRVVVITDNAKYHHATLLLRITLCAETEITLRAEVVKKFPLQA